MSAIHTAAIEMLQGSESAKTARTPEIMADAAYYILTQDPKKVTGNFFIDDTILKEAGITDFTKYACDPANADNLMPDFFVDDNLDLIAGGRDLTASATKKQPEKPQGQVATLFQAIEKSISADTVSKTQAVFQFVVTGEEAGKW